MTDPHKVYICEKFKSGEKLLHLKSVNYLNFGHQVKSYRYPACPRSAKNHNSKLHEDVTSNSVSTGEPSRGVQTNSEQPNSL